MGVERMILDRIISIYKYNKNNKTIDMIINGVTNAEARELLHEYLRKLEFVDKLKAQLTKGPNPDTSALIDDFQRDLDKIRVILASM